MIPDEKIEKILRANQQLEDRVAALERGKKMRRLVPFDFAQGRWIVLLLIPFGLWAATTVPNTFNEGDTLSAAKLNANFQALATAGDATPVGTIVAFAGSTAPTGWLLCDGTQVSRSTYSALYAVVVNAYGTGDGSTSFHLPDLRGRFLRGVDGSAGVDPDKATRTAMNAGGNTGNLIGSVQANAVQGHTHFVTNGVTANGAVSSSNYINLEGTPGSGNSFYLLQGGATVPDRGLTSTNNGNETRPVNAYVNYIIKY